MAPLKNDRVRLAEAARNAGWEVVAENGSTIIEHGDDRIEIEYGSAGIPRTIRRIHDGKTEVISQNYISMMNLLCWIEEKRPKRG